MEHILLTHNVKVCLIVVYAAVIFINVFAYVLKFFKKNTENFITRMKSFWIILILFTLAFCFNKIAAIIFVMLISYLALKEYFSMIPTRPSDRRVLFWTYLSIPVQFYFIYTNWVVMFYLFVPLYMFLLIPIRMVLTQNTDGFLKSCGTIHWGLMTTVYAIGYLGLYVIFPEHINPSGGGIGLLMFVLLLTIGNDFMQYVFGKTFGKHKIIPHVSPNKTWEGFFGGVLSSTIFSILLAPFLTPLSLGQSCFVGVILAIAGFLGDVTMSAVKRDIGVKDTGTLLPGHGGILDRLDSLIFTAPLFFHYIAYTFSIDIL